MQRVHQSQRTISPFCLQDSIVTLKNATYMIDLLASFLLGKKFQNVRFNSAIIIFLLILILGSIPRARAELGVVASGLVLHSLAYSAITFLLFTGLDGPKRSKFVQAVLIVAVMGAIDECIQSFFPYRHAAFSDWLVDFVASLVTAFVLFCMRFTAPDAVKQIPPQ